MAPYGLRPGRTSPRIRTIHGIGANHPSQPSASGGSAAQSRMLPTRAMASVERHQAGSVVAAELISLFAPARWRDIGRHRRAFCERLPALHRATLAYSTSREAGSTTRVAGRPARLRA